jgi:selenocysteine lyase/cysteine desulfurase
LRRPDDRWMTDAQREAHRTPEAEDSRPVVFVGELNVACSRFRVLIQPEILLFGSPTVEGPAEHHSNECSWRESNVTVVVIEEDVHGCPDHAQLERELQTYAHRPLRLASFNAGSNVTGLIPPMHTLAAICHRHGAFILCDFAGSGPCENISPPIHF